MTRSSVHRFHSGKVLWVAGGGGGSLYCVLYEGVCYLVRPRKEEGVDLIHFQVNGTVLDFSSLCVWLWSTVGLGVAEERGEEVYIKS
jgi:hypothetical protein